MDYIVYDKKPLKSLDRNLNFFILDLNKKLMEGYRIYGIYPGFFYLSDLYYSQFNNTKMKSVCFVNSLFNNDFEFFDEVNKKLSEGWKMGMCEDFKYGKKKMRLIVIEKEIEEINEKNKIK